MVVADGQLGGRADHPLGHPAVGLPRADLEAAGQHRAGRASGTRSPAAKLTAPQMTCRSCAVAGGHLAVPDRLAELGQLLDLAHLGHHDAADVVPDLLDRLDLQAGRGEPPGDSAAIDAVRAADSMAAYSSSQDSGTRITPPFRMPG